MVYDLRDCVATIPPYPHYIGERGDGHDVASAISYPDSMWVVRPQLFFPCTLRPTVQPRVATTVILKTLLSTWFSSAPLRIFSFTPLGPWRRTELESCMSPLLSRLSTLAGQRTFWGGCHSFRAFFMATPPLPFQTSTLLDGSRPSNSGVQTALARDRAGAAMFIRSTPGCGTLVGPSPARLGDPPGQ